MAASTSGGASTNENLFLWRVLSFAEPEISSQNLIMSHGETGAPCRQGKKGSRGEQSHPKISSCHMEKRERRADMARKAPARRALLASLTLLSLRPRKHALQGLG